MNKKYYDGFIVFDILEKHLDSAKFIELLNAFAEAKGVDAVEVVRCKDCAYYLTGHEQTRYCAKDGILKRETYYCAGAERKDNGKVSND